MTKFTLNAPSSLQYMNMKKIDIKSLIIGILLASAIFLVVIFVARVMAAY